MNRENRLFRKLFIGKTGYFCKSNRLKPVFFKTTRFQTLAMVWLVRLGQRSHVRGACLHSNETLGRPWSVMCYFNMRHFVSLWVTVIYLGLASLGANSRVNWDCAAGRGGAVLF